MKVSLRGLTLVEVLAVLAILLVLAALLFPVLQKSQMAAKQSRSLAQMRQILAAMALYLDQSDDLPEKLWADVRPLNALVKDTSLWSAPDDSYRLGANPQATHFSGFRVSYYVPVTIQKGFTEELLSVPNFGLLAALHLGPKKRRSSYAMPLNDHPGRYLLGRVDGSVSFRDRELRCTSEKPDEPEADWWHIFAPGVDPSIKLQRSLLAGAAFVPCQSG